MQSDLTVHEELNKQLLAEDERIENCSKEMKKIWAKGHNPNVLLSSRRVTEGSNESIRRFSPGGKFIGWYRHDQKVGKPNSLMPVEQYIENFYKSCRSELNIAYPRSATNSIMGKRSGKKRQEDSLASKIIQENERLDSIGAPKRLRANVILKNTGIDGSLEYVRRVLRNNKK